MSTANTSRATAAAAKPGVNKSVGWWISHCGSALSRSPGRCAQMCRCWAASASAAAPACPAMRRRREGRGIRAAAEAHAPCACKQCKGTDARCHPPAGTAEAAQRGGSSRCGGQSASPATPAQEQASRRACLCCRAGRLCCRAGQLHALDLCLRRSQHGQRTADVMRSSGTRLISAEPLEPPLRDILAVFQGDLGASRRTERGGERRRRRAAGAELGAGIGAGGDRAHCCRCYEHGQPADARRRSPSARLPQAAHLFLGAARRTCDQLAVCSDGMGP